MPSKLSLVFYESLVSVPEKNGLCPRICHFVLTNSFRGARGRQMGLRPWAACFAGPDLHIGLQCMGKVRLASIETSSGREGLSQKVYRWHHLLCTFPCSGVLGALPTFSSHCRLMRVFLALSDYPFASCVLYVS